MRVLATRKITTLVILIYQSLDHSVAGTCFGSRLRGTIAFVRDVIHVAVNYIAGLSQIPAVLDGILELRNVQ